MVDEEKQGRGQLKADRVKQVFADLAADPGLTTAGMLRDRAARRAGLRRSEVAGPVSFDLDDGRDNIVVHGKGSKIRTVPLAPGAQPRHPRLAHGARVPNLVR